ncbi:MAG: ArsR/SmtB family transcription factor [Candidatus Dormibacteria bacterium]
MAQDPNSGAYYEMHAYLCKALAHPVRLLVIDQLRDGPRSVGELATALNLSQSNLSQHLGILRAKRLVGHRREGSNVYYQLRDPRLLQAFDLLREVLRDVLREEEWLAGSYEAPTSQLASPGQGRL